MIQRIGTRMGIEWTNQSLDTVYELTGGHPYMHTSVFSHILKAKRWSNGTRFDFNDVRDGVDSYLRDRDNYICRIWELNMLTRDEKLLLGRIAFGGKTSLPTMTPQPLPAHNQRALQRLFDYGILEAEPGGCHIKGDMYRRWIATYENDFATG